MRRRLTALLREVAVDEILPRYEQVESHRKSDGSIITETDLAVQGRLRNELAEVWPEIGFLGEEMSPEQQAAVLSDSSAGTWCLDPLDGTGNYAAGIPCFAVSLALLCEGRSRVGLVYDPVRDECFSAVAGAGAWLNDRPLQAPDESIELRRATAIVDFKRLPAPLASALATKPPFRSQRSFGSVALDWCWVAAGRGQLYLHGGQKLWDYAAGSLILAESGAAGCPLDALDGEPVPFDSLKPRVGLAATTPALLAEWKAWLLAHS
jgi:myo-inositol-1(or 4)-monophosphatase